MIDKLLYLKLCWNRSNSHLVIPLSIVDKMMMLAILFKVFDITNWIFISCFGIFITFIFILLGHFDIKFKIYDKEQSLNNKYNPEIQKLLGVKQ